MQAQIEHWFTYHSPTLKKVETYTKLRDAARTFALTIDECCPNSADKSAAIRKLRECVMTANASIACDGK